MSEPLTVQDLQSPVWIKLRDKLTARIEYLRSQLECRQEESVTAEYRGRIAEVRALLALSKD